MIYDLYKFIVLNLLNVFLLWPSLLAGGEDSHGYNSLFTIIIVTILILLVGCLNLWIDNIKNVNKTLSILTLLIPFMVLIVSQIDSSLGSLLFFIIPIWVLVLSTVRIIKNIKYR